MIYRLACEPFVLRELSTTCGMSRINHRIQKVLQQLRERVYLGAAGGRQLVCNFVFSTRIVGTVKRGRFTRPCIIFHI